MSDDARFPAALEALRRALVAGPSNRDYSIIVDAKDEVLRRFDQVFSKTAVATLPAPAARGVSLTGLTNPEEALPPADQRGRRPHVR